MIDLCIDRNNMRPAPPRQLSRSPTSMVLEWDRPAAMLASELQFYVLEMDKGNVAGANLKEIFRGMIS